jgi:molybdopterin-guanine dinucleotide biosynthesis protein A
MGTSKALLLFDGQPLIVHVVATLKRLFDDVVVVASPGQDLPSMPVTLVRDEVAYQGPVGGLCYGLTAATGEVCFVTACDSAFLSPALISHLVGRSADFDVVVPHWQGRHQPLHAVYRRSVLPLLEDQLARGDLRPVSLFDRVRTLRIDEEEIRRFDSEGASFFNMNTPADYQEALGRWRTGGPTGDGRQESITCVVELFGVARLLARTSEVALELPRGGTFAQLFGELATTLPVLVGRVLTADRGGLMDGYACSVNGRELVRVPRGAVNAGDNIMILSADAGG